MTWYAKIVGGKVVRIVNDPDSILLAKMMKLDSESDPIDDYRIGEDMTQSFDPDTQVKRPDPIYDVQVDKVVKSYEILDKTWPEYGRVEGSEVVDTRRYEVVPDTEQEAWLVANDYRIIEDGVDVYDEALQRLTSAHVYDIQVDKIVRTHVVVDKTSEQLDREQKIEDSKVVMLASALANKTYVQVETYINNNVTNLASAKEIMVKLGKLVLAILKREDWSS